MIKHLFRVIKIHPKFFFAFIISSSIVACDAFLTIKIFELFINLAQKKTFDYSISLNNEFTLLLIFVLISLILKTLKIFVNRFNNKYNYYIRMYIEESLNNKVSSISYSKLEDSGLYNKMQVVKNYGAEGFSYMLMLIARLVEIAIKMIAYTIILAKIGYQYTILIMLVFIIFFIGYGFIHRIQIKLIKRVTPSSQKRGYYASIGTDKISHQEYQTNQLAPFFIKKYEKENNEGIRFDKKNNLLNFILQLVPTLGLLCLYVFIMVKAFACLNVGSVEIGFVASTILLIGNLHFSCKSFMYLIVQQGFYIKAIEDYFSIIDLDESQQESNQVLRSFESLRLEKIQYNYPNSKYQVLKDINLEINKGEKIFLIGENGCGKTTLISVILNLLDNYEGNIYLNNQVINKNSKAFADQTICLFQDFNKYQMTIRQNLTLGNENIIIEDINEALKSVGLYEYIYHLEGGVDTFMGDLDFGVDFSTGQWQKLIIARLLINKNKNIWILDEPTAYLDPIAEVDFYDLVDKYAQNKTVIFISHRLGYSKKSNKILVMNNGEIIESGSHNELLSRNTVYKQMYEIQKQWYE